MDEVAVSADGLTRRGQATDPSYSELLAGVRGVEFGAKKSRRGAPLLFFWKIPDTIRCFLNFSTTQLPCHARSPAVAGRRRINGLGTCAELLRPQSLNRFSRHRQGPLDFKFAFRTPNAENERIALCR